MYEPTNEARGIQPFSMRSLFLPKWKGNNIKEYKTALTAETKTLEETLNSRAIVNTSTVALTDTTMKTVGRGLKFIATRQKVKTEEYTEGLEGFKRRMRLKLFFHNNNKTTKTSKTSLNTKSQWEPPESNNPKLLRFFKILDTKTKWIIEEGRKNETSQGGNLRKKELKALRSLAKKKDIICKQMDKGGGLCVMDTADYKRKVLNLLEDRTTYRRLSYDPTQHVINEVNDLIAYMYRQHVVDEKVATNLRPKNPCRCPLFYGLPKVHKTDIPLRPIVSGCEGPTDHLSNFVTQYIQPIAELLPAYFKDSADLLRHLQHQNATLEEYFLVTADVTSLYTNIPHQEGMEAIAHYLHLHSDFVYPPHLPTIPPIPYVIRIIKTILESSTFEFGGTHYHQISGTSMGTRMAPPYANLFMGRIDEAIINEFSVPIRNYKRFIDDVFFTFHGPRRELDRAMEFMNGLHKDIKFTFHVSTESIAFMDLTLSRNNIGGIGSKLYRKPTDTNSLLHFHSNHPRHQKEGIIYGQTLRLNKLISDTADLKTELINLAKILITKKTPLHLINFQIQKGLTKTQTDLLKTEVRGNRRHNASNKIKTNENFLPIVMPYSSIGRKINTMVVEHWKIIENDTYLSSVFRQKPTKAYKNTKSIKDILISTRFHEEKPTNSQHEEVEES